MKTEITERQTDDCIEQFLVTLDRDIEYLEDTMTQLNELRSLVIKQDSNALGQLLGKIQDQAKTYQQNIMKRKMLRKKIAIIMDCTLEEATLTRIKRYLDSNKSSDIESRKNKLRALTGRLKIEYAATQSLLVDCARFNRLLLKSIFETGRAENITYRPTGTAERQMNPVFMNLQF